MEKRDYEGALYYLMTETVAYNDNKLIPLAKQALDDLQELVKRNEPMKVKRKTYLTDINCDELIGLCPNCNRFVKDIYKRCPDCGQKLDWSDEK